MSEKEHIPENPESPVKKSGDQTPEVRYVPIEYLQSIQDDEDQINLLDLAKTIWEGRMLIMKTVIVFIIVGLIVALGSPEEYTSEVRLLPERQQTTLGGLGMLARQFGVTSGQQQTSEGIPPNLYPDIIQSTAFLREMLDYEVALPDGGHALSLMEYLSEHQSTAAISNIIGYVSSFTIRLPYTVIGWFRGGSDDEMLVVDPEIAGNEKQQRLVRMTSEEWSILSNLSERISAEINRETGVVTIFVRMQNDVIAADVADEVVVRLSDYITNYRTEKARHDVDFIEQRYEEARQRFDEALLELALFSDENRGGQLTAMARTEEQRLQSQFNLTFNLYNTMAERLEEARIKLQEETPVVNILEPAVVPNRRSEPKRKQIMIIYTFLGGLIGAGLIFVRQGFNYAKERFVST
jgi:uncharacterized protein involved in exopolysaccharide biosynthesis